MRSTLFLLAMVAAVPAQAQVDPVQTAQGQLLSSMAHAQAERDYARQRGGVPRKTAAQRRHEADCAKLWKLHGRMTAAQASKLYDLCPR